MGGTGGTGGVILAVLAVLAVNFGRGWGYWRCNFDGVGGTAVIFWRHCGTARTAQKTLSNGTCSGVGGTKNVIFWRYGFRKLAGKPLHFRDAGAQKFGGTI